MTNEKTNKKEIAERLEYLRKQKGLSYKDLGDIINRTGDTVRKAIERGSIKEVHLNTFSYSLGINKNWLLTGEGEMEADVSSDNVSKTSNEIKNTHYYKNKYGDIPDDDLRVLFVVNHDRLLKSSEEYRNFIEMIEAKAKKEYLEFLIEKGVIKPASE